MPSKAFLALNPDYAKKMPRSFEALQKTPRQVLRDKRLAIEGAAAIEGTPLERAFLRAWGRSDPEFHLRPEREFRFVPTRRWRFDFAWPSARVAVEVEGGVYARGRHNRPQGFIGDCAKYNRAALEGWTVFRIPTGGVKYDLVESIHEFIRSRQQAA